MTPTADAPTFASDLPIPNDPYIYLRLHRGTLAAFIASAIVHLLVLFAIPRPPMETGGAMGGAPSSLQVRINSPDAATGDISSAEPEVANPKAAPPSRAKRKTVSKPILALNKPADPQTPRVAPPPAEPATDLQSFVKAAQNRRRAAQGLPPLESSDADPEEAARMANVMRNLRAGTNGIFQLLSISSRSAAFSFRGWTTDALNARREYIPVDIGNNSSIEIAVVRKMIELIRRYYKGNFNWESQRLDRVVVLSARLEDNEGLEEFLLREFFGSPQRR